MSNRILIIDDDVRITRMMVRRLKKAGFEVKVCDNGSDGIQAAFEMKPDLILLDIYMPGMNGYEVIGYLRDNNYTGMVVACSASVNAQETSKTIDAGCDHFLPKPIGLDFEGSVQELINSGKSG